MPPKSKQEKCRGASWKEEEENLCLLTLWQELSVEDQLDDPKLNNAGIYRRLALEMNEKGHDETSDQCKAKMHTLKRGYRLCKGTLNKSGKGRKTCKYYDILDAILGTRPASSPVKIIEPLSKKKRVADSESGQSDAEDLNDDVGNLSEPNDNGDDGRPDTVQNNEEIESPKQTTETDESAKPSTSKNGNEVIVENAKENHAKDKTRKTEKRQRSTWLEITLGSVMEGFSHSNEKADEIFLSHEKQKLEVEMKWLDFEKKKLEEEEQQRRGERQHQYSMMQMIMGMVGRNPMQSSGTLQQVPVQDQIFTHPQGASYSQNLWSNLDDSRLDHSNDSSYFNL